MPLSLPGSQLHREVGETREDDDDQPQVRLIMLQQVPQMAVPWASASPLLLLRRRKSDSKKGNDLS